MVASDTRSRIIAAAIEVLGENGVTGFRLVDVASAIDIKEPTIFHYFKNRQDLIDAAQVEYYRSTYLAIMAPMGAALKFSDSRDQWRSAIVKVLEDSFVPGRERVRSLRAGVFGSAQTNPNVREQVAATHREVTEFLADLFVQARDRGWVRSDCNLHALAAVILGVIAGRAFVEIDDEFSHIADWDKIVFELVPNLMEPENYK